MEAPVSPGWPAAGEGGHAWVCSPACSQSWVPQRLESPQAQEGLVGARQGHDQPPRAAEAPSRKDSSCSRSGCPRALARMPPRAWGFRPWPDSLGHVGETLPWSEKIRAAEVSGELAGLLRVRDEALPFCGGCTRVGVREPSGPFCPCWFPEHGLLAPQGLPRFASPGPASRFYLGRLPRARQALVPQLPHRLLQPWGSEVGGGGGGGVRRPLPAPERWPASRALGRPHACA